jgi:hypothetical protein
LIVFLGFLNSKVILLSSQCTENLLILVLILLDLLFSVHYNSEEVSILEYLLLSDLALVLLIHKDLREAYGWGFRNRIPIFLHGRWSPLLLQYLLVELCVSEKCLFSDLPLEVFPILKLLHTFQKELMVTGLLVTLDNIDVLMLGINLHGQVVTELLLASELIQSRLL